MRFVDLFITVVSAHVYATCQLITVQRVYDHTEWAKKVKPKVSHKLPLLQDRRVSSSFREPLSSWMDGTMKSLTHDHCAARPAVASPVRLRHSPLAGTEVNTAWRGDSVLGMERFYWTAVYLLLVLAPLLRDDGSVCLIGCLSVCSNNNSCIFGSILMTSGRSRLDNGREWNGLNLLRLGSWLVGGAGVD